MNYNDTLNSNNTKIQDILEDILSLQGTATADKVFAGEEFLGANGKEAGTFTLENELSEQSTTLDDIEEMLEAKLGNYPVVRENIAAKIVDRNITEITASDLDGAVSIGPYAFYNHTGLANITIPSTATRICNYAFSGCSALATVLFEKSTVFNYIDKDAFRNCTALINVTLPDSVKLIGENVFYGCTKLTRITIPDNVTDLGTYTFYNCSQLTEVLLGKGLQKIPNYAFMNTGLTNLNLPDNVTTIGQYAFSKTKITNLIIPDSVETIGQFAFDLCSNLATVKLSINLTTLNQAVFSACPNLVEIDIPNKVTSIGREVFFKCTGLTRISLPDSLTSLGYGVFTYDDALSSVEGGQNLTSLGERVFRYCAKLTSLSYPKVTDIGKNAFEGCTELHTINLPLCISAGPLSGGNGEFMSCSALTNVNIPLISRISNNMFSGCSSLKKLDFHNVTNIGTSAFKNCTLDTLILRGEAIATLANINAFNGTSVENGTGYIYVRKSLLSDENAASDYRRATNWSTYATQFRALEDYTLDGTVTGEFDPSKIEEE